MLETDLTQRSNETHRQREHDTEKPHDFSDRLSWRKNDPGLSPSAPAATTPDRRSPAAGRNRHRSFLAFWGLALTAGLLAGSAFGANAQERPRTVLDMLFGGPAAPPPGARPLYRVGPGEVQRRRQAKPQRSRTRSRSSSGANRESGSSSASPPAPSNPAIPSSPAAASAAASASEPSHDERNAAAPASEDETATAQPAEKTRDAQKILVVGDFMAAGLADGLNDLYADEPNIVVDDDINGSSGLVRDDFYDWPAELGGILEDEKPAVLVMMIGSNDRQSMRLGSTTASVRSDGWTSRYEKRIGEIVEVARKHDVPLVWVGLPPFKASRVNEDMVFLNDLYRKGVGSSTDDAFVDIWDGFVDADDNFVTSGPDVNGQSARLRNSDGITMTDAGDDKLAFFADKAIERFLKGPGDGPSNLSPGGGRSPDKTASSAGPAGARTFAPIALDDPSLDGPDRLLGAAKPADFSPRPSTRERLVVEGEGTGHVAGRADDFAWNQKSNAPSPQAPGITYRGTINLDDVRRSQGIKPPKAMPGILDAIMDSWNQDKTKPLTSDDALSVDPQN